MTRQLFLGFTDCKDCETLLVTTWISIYEHLTSCPRVTIHGTSVFAWKCVHSLYGNWSLSHVSIQRLMSLFFPYLLKNLIYLFLIGGKLLYNVALVSAVRQCESAMNKHISPPSWASLPFPSQPSRSSQSTRMGSLCYIASSHQLVILHMIVCTYQDYFLHSSHPLPLSSILCICIIMVPLILTVGVGFPH